MPPSASIVLYGITTCDTCRKARRWLDSHGVAYRYHDLRADGIDADTLDRWIGELGIETVVNRRSATWRKLSADLRREPDAAAMRDLALAHPTLVKRPVVDLGDRRLVGFGPFQQKTIVDAAPRSLPAGRSDR